MAREHDDTVRAALFYNQLLASYCSHAKVHEAIYVAEALAALYIDVGNFRLARGYLEGAADVLSERTTTYGGRCDPRVAQLRVRACVSVFTSRTHSHTRAHNTVETGTRVCQVVSLRSRHRGARSSRRV